MLAVWESEYSKMSAYERREAAVQIEGGERVRGDKLIMSILMEISQLHISLAVHPWVSSKP